MTPETPKHDNASARRASKDYAYLLAQTLFENGATEKDVRARLAKEPGVSSMVIDGAVKKWGPKPQKAAGPEVEPHEAPLTAEEQLHLATLREQRQVLPSLRTMYQSVGILEEDIDPACLIFFIGQTRLLPTAFSVEVRGESSVGKSALLQRVLGLMPPETVKRYTGVSEKFFTRLPKDALKQKVVYFKEAPGAEGAAYDIRMITDDTEGGLRFGALVENKKAGGWESREYVLEGPTVFITSSTRTTGSAEDDARRFLLQVSDSKERVEKIQQKIQQEAESGKKGAETFPGVRAWWAWQRELRPAQVEVPFAHHIRIASDKPRVTRDLQRTLGCIQAHALFLQHARQVNETPAGRVVIATLEDYRAVFPLFDAVLDESLAEVAKPLRELLEVVTNGAETREKMIVATKWERTKVHRRIRTLVKRGLLEEDTKAKPYTYTVVQGGQTDGPQGGTLLPAPDDVERDVARCSRCMGLGVPQAASLQEPLGTASERVLREKMGPKTEAESPTALVGATGATVQRHGSPNGGEHFPVQRIADLFDGQFES